MIHHIFPYSPYIHYIFTIYSSGHTLRTPFGKRMVETSAAECVLSIHLEHLKKHTLRTCSKRYLEHFGVIYVF